MSESRITYTPYGPEATAEAEVAALSNVYRLIFNRHANTNAAGVASTNGTNVRDTEEVGDVGQRPD
jgi:hypothetical protein